MDDALKAFECIFEQLVLLDSTVASAMDSIPEVEALVDLVLMRQAKAGWRGLDADGDMVIHRIVKAYVITMAPFQYGMRLCAYECDTVLTMPLVAHPHAVAGLYGTASFNKQHYSANWAVGTPTQRCEGWDRWL